MAILTAERALDAQRFDDKVHRLHLDVMTTLAQMLAKECKDGHCEVCHGSCVKPSLSEIGVCPAAELRGHHNSNASGRSTRWDCRAK